MQTNNLKIYDLEEETEDYSPREKANQLYEGVSPRIKRLENNNEKNYTFFQVGTQRDKNDELLKKCKEARNMLMPKLKSLNILGKPKKYNHNKQSKKKNGAVADNEPDETELNMVKGKMYINDLWNKKQTNQVTIASKLQDLRRVMDQYKKNLDVIKTLDLDANLQDELDRHLSELSNVAKIIKEDVQKSNFHSAKIINTAVGKKHLNEISTFEKQIYNEFKEVQNRMDKKNETCFTDNSKILSGDFSQFNFSKIEKSALKNYRPSKLNLDFLAKSSTFRTKNRNASVKQQKVEPRKIFNEIRLSKPEIYSANISKKYYPQELFKNNQNDYADISNKKVPFLSHQKTNDSQYYSNNTKINENANKYEKPKIKIINDKTPSIFLKKENPQNLTVTSSNFKTIHNVNHQDITSKNEKKNISLLPIATNMENFKRSSEVINNSFADYLGPLKSQRNLRSSNRHTLCAALGKDMNIEISTHIFKEEVDKRESYNEAEPHKSHFLSSKNIMLNNFDIIDSKIELPSHKKTRPDSSKSNKSIYEVSEKSITNIAGKRYPNLTSRHKVSDESDFTMTTGPKFNIGDKKSNVLGHSKFSTEFKITKKAYKTARATRQNKPFNSDHADKETDPLDKNYKTIDIGNYPKDFKSQTIGNNFSKAANIDIFENIEYENNLLHNSLVKNTSNITNRRDIKKNNHSLKRTKQDIENTRKDFLDTKINFLTSYLKHKENEFLTNLKFNVIPHKVHIHRDTKGYIYHKNDEDGIISGDPKVGPNQLKTQDSIKNCTRLINGCLNHVNISKKEVFIEDVNKFLIEMENINEKKDPRPVLTSFQKSMLKYRIEHIRKTQRRDLVNDFVDAENDFENNKNDDKIHSKQNMTPTVKERLENKLAKNKSNPSITNMKKRQTHNISETNKGFIRYNSNEVEDHSSEQSLEKLKDTVRITEKSVEKINLSNAFLFPNEKGELSVDHKFLEKHFLQQKKQYLQQFKENQRLQNK